METSLCVWWDVPFRYKLLSFLTIFCRLQKYKAVVVYLKCPEELDIEAIGVVKRPQGLGQPFVSFVMEYPTRSGIWLFFQKSLGLCLSGM